MTTSSGSDWSASSEGWSDVDAQVRDDQLIRDGETIERTVTIDKSNGCTWNSISVSLVWVEWPYMDSSTQRYALMATACFGRVDNTLDTSQDAFVTDDSADRRTRNIIITVCSIFGALVVFGVACWWCRRRKDDGGGEAAAVSAGASAPVAESVKKVSSSSEEERAAPQNEEVIEVEAAKDDDDKDHSA